MNTELQFDENTFEIPECNLPEVKKEIERLNRRAAKLGAELITIEISPEAHITERVVPWTREEEEMIAELIQSGAPGFMAQPKRIKLKARIVRIVGKAPSLNGWKFAATLDHLPGGQATIVRSVPGANVSAEKYAKAAPYCSHCKTKRVRKDTFVLRHEDGREIQLGRSCIKDFLDGHGDPVAFAHWMEELQKIREGLGSFGVIRDFAGRYCIPLLRFLAYTMQAIRMHGFVSKKLAQERENLRTTSGRASAALYFRENAVTAEEKRQAALLPAPTTEDELHAANALAWMRALQPRGDFETNLKTLALADLPEVEPRHLGLLAAGASSYLKARELESNRVKYNQSKHVGTAKERGNMILTVRSIRSYEGQDGNSFTVVKFGDQEGNLFAWITGVDLPDNVAEEKSFEVRATVKAHTEYKGVKETKLSRVSFVREVEVAQPELKQKEAVNA